MLLEFKKAKNIFLRRVVPVSLILEAAAMTWELPPSPHAAIGALALVYIGLKQLGERVSIFPRLPKLRHQRNSPSPK